MATIEESLDEASAGIDRILAERALLLDALNNMCESAINDSDACVYCGRDVLRHKGECPVTIAIAAIAKAEGR